MTTFSTSTYSSNAYILSRTATAALDVCWCYGNACKRGRSPLSSQRNCAFTIIVAYRTGERSMAICTIPAWRHRTTTKHCLIISRSNTDHYSENRCWIIPRCRQVVMSSEDVFRLVLHGRFTLFIGFSILKSTLFNRILYRKITLFNRTDKIFWKKTLFLPQVNRWISEFNVSCRETAFYK